MYFHDLSYHHTESVSYHHCNRLDYLFVPELSRSYHSLSGIPDARHKQANEQGKIAKKKIQEALPLSERNLKTTV